jgi:hypothetical protein
MAKKKLVVATEVWETQQGRISKAVVRNADGTFNGATNQTKGVRVRAKSASRIKRTPSLSLVGR